MFAMETLDDLWEHIAYTLAYAPDFPRRDFLSDAEQMNLDRAFEQLRQGVLLAYPDEGFAANRKASFDLLDQSYLAFTTGDDLTAGKLLNEFQDSIFVSEA